MITGTPTMIKRGKYTYGSPDVRWSDSGADLICGKFCSIAGNVRIYLGGNHRSDFISTYPFGHIHKEVFNLHKGEGHPSTKGNVVIGNDVWIGEYATIMSGVTIGDGAIIANNSHVVKDIEPYAIYGGNPAKFIKLRFSEDQIASLLKIQWWNWPTDKINENAHLLCSPSIDDFIKMWSPNTVD